MRRMAILVGLMGLFGIASGACSGASGGSDSGGAGGTGNVAAMGGTGNVAAAGGSIGDSGPGGIGGGCASDIYDGELVPVDMFVMLDRSGSMQDNGKWTAVSQAFKDFVALPNLSKLGMGISFFPTKPAVPPPSAPCASDADCAAYGPCVPVFNQCSGALSPNDSCVAPDYAKPVVPIADLPGVGNAIITAIGGQSPNGSSTPTAPALEGAIDYAQIWAGQNPTHVTVVVLATDGEPTNCNPNRVETVAERAAEGLAQNPSIKTFVIGVGDQLTTLNLIAQKGGTDKAIIVGTSNAAQEFLAALDKIRGAVSCQYQIPKTPDGKKPDFKKLNVAFTVQGGSQEVFPQVGSAAECQGKKAWYYDNPASPSQIILCPAACDVVENSPTGSAVEVVLGCETIVT